MANVLCFQRGQACEDHEIPAAPLRQPVQDRITTCLELGCADFLDVPDELADELGVGDVL